jgi:long-subunit acyl-CoA synthetase (AMP-forming)
LKSHVISWETFLDLSDKNEKSDLNHRLDNQNMTWPVTIMYTSGSTDQPKGVIFNQVNLMSKRFARAMALPSFSSSDTFLSYLPLFHTFGRYFELLGSIFWGATYAFAESPAFNSLLKDFQLVRPSIFISVPKRWVQLYEYLEGKIELDSASDEIIRKQLSDITGGQLQWGLSAAGYLDPDMFKFFQEYGVQLLSGYGMTEATGGITMTQPGDYMDNSVGKSLPGINLKLANDGELLMQGSYVSNGFYKNDYSESFKNGWFHSGDIFEKRDDHFFILDRKKDIYKNSRGQTIAPQKIENLFQDFDSVKSIFLVGDEREFNTVLIYPNKENIPLNYNNIDNQDIRDLFSAMLVSVNSFLSPFERIVNFAIIDRDFSIDKGDLTQKGTFNRKNILKNFSETIEPMYTRNYVSLYSGTKEIRFPNWLVREKGTVKTNLGWDGNKIFIEGQDQTLKIIWTDSNLQVGEFSYYIDSQILDLQLFINSPSLWLGNNEFTLFTSKTIFRIKDTDPNSDIRVRIDSNSFALSKIDKIDNEGDTNLL